MAEYFVLNTGAKIPSVGLGTWQAEPGVVGPAVIAAVKAGYRHIDCALVYGNEKEVGLALKQVFDQGIVKREDLFITSKLWCSDHAPEDVPEALETTLKDLQLHYVDLYLIHCPFRVKKGASLSPQNYVTPDIPATWAALEKLYDSGKARAIGVSNFSSKKLEDLLAVARVPPAVNQVESHPGWQQPKLHQLCQSKGVHLSAFSPLGSPGTKSVKILSHPIIIKVAETLGRSPAQVALRWGLQVGHSVLPKSIGEARIKENIDIFGWSIPDDLFAKFSEIEQVGFYWSRLDNDDLELSIEVMDDFCGLHLRLQPGYFNYSWMLVLFWDYFGRQLFLFASSRMVVLIGLSMDACCSALDMDALSFGLYGFSG